MLLTAILNWVLNWTARETGLFNPDTIHDTLFPSNRFLGKEMDFQVRMMHGILVLKTYGFEIRRKDLKPEVLEKFLRERMKHYSFDLPYELLFGEPIGEWPRT